MWSNLMNAYLVVILRQTAKDCSHGGPKWSNLGRSNWEHANIMHPDHSDSEAAVQMLDGGFHGWECFWTAPMAVQMGEGLVWGYSNRKGPPK